MFDRVVSQVKDGWFTSVSFLQVIITECKTSKQVNIRTLLKSVEKSGFAIVASLIL